MDVDSPIIRPSTLESVAAILTDFPLDIISQDNGGRLLFDHGSHGIAHFIQTIFIQREDVGANWLASGDFGNDIAGNTAHFVFSDVL
jgi:hypothetical protein